MKQLQRLSRIILQVQKVILAISTLIFLTLLFGNCSPQNGIIKNNNFEVDYLLLNQLLSNTSMLSKDRNISFKISNNNESVISILKELKKCDSDGNKFKLDSLKKDIGIYNDNNFEKIFNQNEYDFLISQNKNTEWDYQKITVPKISRYEKENFVKKQIIVQISKPIYTSNKKFAIVHVIKNTSDYMLIYKKNKKKWVEYKLFSPFLN